MKTRNFISSILSRTPGKSRLNSWISNLHKFSSNICCDRCWCSTRISSTGKITEAWVRRSGSPNNSFTHKWELSEFSFLIIHDESKNITNFCETFIKVLLQLHLRGNLIFGSFHSWSFSIRSFSTYLKVSYCDRKNRVILRLARGCSKVST